MLLFNIATLREVCTARKLPVHFFRFSGSNLESKNNPTVLLPFSGRFMTKNSTCSDSLNPDAKSEVLNDDKNVYSHVDISFGAVSTI